MVPLKSRFVPIPSEARLFGILDPVRDVILEIRPSFYFFGAENAHVILGTSCPTTGLLLGAFFPMVDCQQERQSLHFL